MTAHKPASVLIDSNVMIAAEDYADRASSGGELASALLRLIQELGFSVCVSDGTRTDLLRAKGELRQRRSRQLRRYHTLEPVSVDEELARQAGFPANRSENDEGDLEVLSAFMTGAADVLVTEDAKLRRRARNMCDPERVHSLSEAVEWLTSLRASPVTLPSVRTVEAYTLRLSAPIFDGLREDYPTFDQWWHDKVCGEKRKAALIGSPDNPAGIAVFKPERNPHSLGPVLKVCTFKTSNQVAGTKSGELLLKAAIDFGRRNQHPHMFMEVLPHHADLIGWLMVFGFRLLPPSQEDFAVMVKDLEPGAYAPAETPLQHAVRYGPGSVRVERAFAVPIQAKWHQLLLPEAPDPSGQLSLEVDNQPCGNAIRKAYLCQATIKALGPGDLLAFIRTSPNAQAGTYWTASGVVEETLRSDKPTAIAAFVGARTVYTLSDIEEMCASGEVLAIRFRFDRILEPALPIGQLMDNEATLGTPQSIAKIREGGFTWVVQMLGE